MKRTLTRTLFLSACLFVVGLLLAACGSSASQGGDDSQNTSDSSTPTQPSGVDPTPTAAGEMMMITTLEGEVQVPAPSPGSLHEILVEKVEAGEWARGEGLVLLLKLVAGELETSEIPEAEGVIEANPTGVLREASDYLEEPERTPQYVPEIERLIGKLTPTQEDLDRLSNPAVGARRGGVYMAGMSRQADVPPECAHLEQEGFKASLEGGGYCFVYEEEARNGFRDRIYYPKWWRDDSEMMAYVDEALGALRDSASVYTKYGSYEDVNLVMGATEGIRSIAYQSKFSKGEACPITVLQYFTLPRVAEFRQQAIAHEAFHCFQDWNFSYATYRTQLWWRESTAQYFSNVVYPNQDLEHKWLEKYYIRSIERSWFGMSYENYLLMQFLANKNGDNALIQLMQQLSDVKDLSSQQAILSGYPNMDALFLEFVVATMGPGVQDSNGEMILVKNPPLIRVEYIREKGEKEFEIEPFVAGRYGGSFQKEKRFLEAFSEQEVRHSAAVSPKRHDLKAWSDLPEEVRSSCKENVVYRLAVTSVDQSGALKDVVNLVEKAVCDPCVLGTWEMDPDSFEAALGRLIAAHGLDQLPIGVVPEIEIAGHDYHQFDIEGVVRGRRVDFQLSFVAEGYPPMIHTVDAQRFGTYAADGEELTVWNMVETTNSVVTSVEGMDIVSQTPDVVTFGPFGSSDTMAQPGDLSGGTPFETAPYVCTDETLEITHPDFGAILFHRVDEIIPTPVPTPSSTGE
jgi:hypothetical protein